ncbi:MAG: hypothetical protein FWC02_01385 [Firmicutes bacterium]|nr:hypothetical protein [Bacillota bacterium]
MIWLKCECGNVFHEEDIIVVEQRHDYGDTYASEYFNHSPCCNDTNFEKIENYCEFCEGECGCDNEED